MKKDRLKVTITCKQCGERFTLRGRKSREGDLSTGFVRCLCNNENDFLIRTEEEL
jgi:hypothetical protein